MRSSVAALLLAALALLFVAAPSAQSPQVPAAVSPFPRGLTGTIAFQSDMRSPGNPDGRTRIYTIDLATGAVTALTTAPTWDDEQPQWSPEGRAIMPNVSPDGGWVAFASQSLPSPWGWDYQVQVLEIATKQTWPFDESGPACWPKWSPDAQSIAHVSLKREPSVIQTLNSFGLSPQPIAGVPARWHYYPDWSPDGQLLAVSVSPEHFDGQDWDLAIVDPSRAMPYQRLTTGPGNDRLPDWRPR